MNRTVMSPMARLVLSMALAGCYVTAQPAPPPSNGEVFTDAPPPPPPPPPEPIPPSPGPDNVWVAGYHRWDGHAYSWQRGHYERPPRPNSRYVQGNWERRGNRRVWVDAHWE